MELNTKANDSPCVLCIILSGERSPQNPLASKTPASATALRQQLCQRIDSIV